MQRNLQRIPEIAANLVTAAVKRCLCKMPLS